MNKSFKYHVKNISSIRLVMLLLILITQESCSQNPNPVYPPSNFITGINFNFNTVDERAPGSDNWPITWAADDNQYTSWGDGGGFRGTNNIGRVSMGVARVEGDKDNYTGYNVWGGYNAENPAQFEGKSYGILSIGETLWMWRTGNASENTAFLFQELYKSTNYGATWEFTGVRFDDNDFGGFPKFFSVTFCQFGQAYKGARDDYVYMYAPEAFVDVWEIQYPGEIILMRVLKDQMENKSAYRFFAGLDENNYPLWTADVHHREPVFEDTQNGAMMTSVSYNAGLQRYLLTVQHVGFREEQNGHIGIYEASEPWGPWYTVLFENAWDISLQNGTHTVFWNFSNKWTSADGKNFVMVMTGLGSDNWGTIEGTFITNTVNVNENIIEQMPAEIKLHQNYPNPFNSNTAIKFSVGANALVEVNIYDLLGTKIKQIFKSFVHGNENREVSFNADDLTSGVYFYEVFALSRKEFRGIKKMILLR